MSEVIEINGGVALKGSVRISGAKNAALPLLMASLMTSETCVFENVPNLEDVNLTLHLLEHFGAETEYFGDKVKVAVPRLLATEASYSLVKALRASFWVLGPILARGGAARVALPGGDIIGARPVDMHLAGLEAMGAEIKVKHGVVFATAPKGLHPATIELRFPSVGATHQIIMAASLTPGTTTIKRAAREPEVIALADLINRMGGEIEGAGSETVVVRGKSELGGASIKLIGDRVEAGTYLLAGIATGGDVKAVGINPGFFGEFLDLLSELGVDVEVDEDSIRVRRNSGLKPLNVLTGPFPQFATDLQAPLMAVLALGNGSSTVEENVFEGRFGHVSELCRMGAQITIHERIATVHGVPKLMAAPVEAHDIRAGAALVIAALAAEGRSEIFEPHHLRRGYETLEIKLSGLGARIRSRVTDPEDYMVTGC